LECNRNQSQHKKTRLKVAQKINPNAKTIIGGTFFLNLLTGMRGGSGGSLFPPFLRTMKIDVHKAIATS